MTKRSKEKIIILNSHCPSMQFGSQCRQCRRCSYLPRPGVMITLA